MAPTSLQNKDRALSHLPALEVVKKKHGGCTKSIFYDKVQVGERKGHLICILMYSTASAPGKQGGIRLGRDLYWFDGDDAVSHLRFEPEINS